MLCGFSMVNIYVIGILVMLIKFLGSDQVYRAHCLFPNLYIYTKTDFEPSVHCQRQTTICIMFTTFIFLYSDF